MLEHTQNWTRKGNVMMFTIKSRRLKKDITFSRPGSKYVFVDLNGQPGTLGNQICDKGSLSGSTITHSGESEDNFKAICRKWFKQYLKNEREMI